MKMCTMLNVIKFAPVCMRAIAFNHDYALHFCTINLPPSHPVFHADELSQMLCNIIQPVKWLLGSTGYHFSPA